MISVIIPVYKTEEYLRECVDSILAQSNQDVEVILVDDGSPDQCPRICDEYRNSDPRVKVVHKENGGLSSARNAGLSVAEGHYVTFVDSDDKIFPGSMTEIIRWTESGDVDICFLKSVKLYPDGTQIDLGENISGSQIKTLNREDAVRYLATRAKYPGSAWGKLFKREFLIDNKLHFPYDRRYSEDVGFIRDCILSAHTFDALEVPYYQYRQNRPESITNKVTARNFYDLFMFITESVDKLTFNKKAISLSNRYGMSFVAYEYAVLLHVYNHIPAAERKEALKKLKEYKWVLRYSGNVKTKLISMVSNLLGVQFAAFCVGRIGKVIRK